MTLFLYVLASVSLVVACLRKPLRHAQAVLITILLMAVACTSYAEITAKFPGIGTDSMGLTVYSGELLLHGINPYGKDLSAYHDRFRMSGHVMTPRVDGSSVNIQPYPALSFLIYIPSLLLHFDPRWISVLAHVFTLLLLYVIAPRQLRIIAVMVLSFNPDFYDYDAGSVTDVTYIPFLCAAAFWWIRRPILASAMIALACALKQDAWLDLPAFFFGIYLLSEGSRSSRLVTVARGTVVAIVVWLIPNIYFMVNDFAGWKSGILEPFIDHNVEFGSGVINLFLQSKAIASPQLMTIAALAVAASMLGLFIIYPRKLRNVMWLLPGMMLFMAPRSLQNYFLYLIPVCMASLFGSLRPVVLARCRAIRRLTPPIVSATSLLAIVCVGLIGCSQEIPVNVAVVKLISAPQVDYLEKLDIRVTNNLTRPLSASYLVATNGYNQSLWTCSDGCPSIPTGQSRNIELESGKFGTLVPSGSEILVRVVDRRTRREYNSDPFTVLLPLYHVANPALALPDSDFQISPLDWSLTGLDRMRGALVYSTNNKRGSIRATLRAVKLGSTWNILTASTSFIPLDEPFTAHLSTETLYRGGEMPTQFAGIQIADDTGHFVTFCWGNVTSTTTYSAGGIYVVEPKRAAGLLRIDVRKYAAAAHLVLTAPMSIAFTLASTDPKGGQRSTFAGLDISPSENVLSKSIYRPTAD